MDKGDAEVGMDGGGSIWVNLEVWLPGDRAMKEKGSFWGEEQEIEEVGMERRVNRCGWEARTPGGKEHRA